MYFPSNSLSHMNTNQSKFHRSKQTHLKLTLSIIRSFKNYFILLNLFSQPSAYIRIEEIDSNSIGTNTKYL